jgi:hypothetical protein
VIITAKFASTCPCCGKPIAVGSKVNWSKGSKGTHVSCGSAPTSASASRREDCRKYGWDGVVGSSSYYTSGQYDEDS